MPVICFSQTEDYEQEMASLVVKFKTKSQLKKDRKALYNEVVMLRDEIKTHMQIMDDNNPNYYRLKSISDKVDALWSYIGCFANLGLMEYKEFEYINQLMNISPKKNGTIKNETMNFYDIKIGSFRAIMVHNPAIPNYNGMIPDLKTVEVSYNVADEYGNDAGKGSLNVGGGDVRCLYDSNDDGSFYNVINVRCRKL